MLWTLQTFMAQCFSDSLGDDYVKLNLSRPTSKSSQRSLLQNFIPFRLVGWARHGDPQNYLIQEAYGYDNAYCSPCTNISSVEENENNKELLNDYKRIHRMLRKKLTTSLTYGTNVTQHLQKQAYMIDNALVIPDIVTLRRRLVFDVNPIQHEEQYLVARTTR